MGGEQAVVLAKLYHTASPASEGDVPSQAVERGPLELPVSAGSKGTLDN